MLRRIALALCATLAACSPARPLVVVEPVEILVPVPAECPAPPIVYRPALPVAALHPDASPADVARAYVATIVVLQAYAAELETLLAAYRRPASADSTVGPSHP